jgi:hypothetical protein
MNSDSNAYWFREYIPIKSHHRRSENSPFEGLYLTASARLHSCCGGPPKPVWYRLKRSCYEKERNRHSDDVANRFAIDHGATLCET